MNVPGSPHNPMPADQHRRTVFTRQVHGVLSHLYDNAFLESHPLATLIGTGTEHMTRAQQLRRALLACIESLRPALRDEPSPADSTRAYAIFSYRYVDGLAIEDICERLALSRRQFYREHEKGMRAVATLLWDKLQPALQDAAISTGADTPDSRQALAAEEVARLRQAQQLQRIRVRHVIDETLALLEPVLQQSGRRVEVAPGADPIVLADRVMLRQALLNVLNQLSRQAPGDLRVSLTQAGGGTRVVIDEPSGDVALDMSAADFGIARALIVEQGGELVVASDEGRPYVALTLPASHQPAMLVNDDNADLVALFQRYLGGHAVTVIGATTGDEALRLAREMMPRAITLDVMMPRQDGWDILQKLKKMPETSDIPVIVCSVLHESQLAMSMGASGYITKPVNQAEFLAVVGRWLPAMGSTE